MTCYAKMAGSSEPSTYTVTQVTTTQITVFMMAFENVLYPDELLTSPTASFVAATDVGKDFCVAAIPQSCGTIGAVISGTTLVGWGIWNTSTSVADTATITSFTGTSPPLTFSAANTFTAHQVVTYYGFSGVNSQLNGQIAQIPNATGTSFSSGSLITGSGYNGSCGGTCGYATFGFEYRYGTDNTAALQNALNGIPNGGTILLPAGGMMVLGTSQTATRIKLPNNVPVNIRGQGSGSANWEVYYQIPPLQTSLINNPVAMGSEIVVANTALTSGEAFLLSPLPTVNGAQCVLSYHLEDFTLWGGAGVNSDGGNNAGTPLVGFEASPFCRLLIENIEVGNFSGDNLFLNTGPSSFSDMLTMTGSYSLLSGGDGLRLGTAQNMTLINNTFDTNTNYGIQITPIAGQTYFAIWAFEMVGNTISRNGLAEMQLDTGQTLYNSSACDIMNNYWEHDTSNVIPMFNNVGQMPCRFGPQTVVYAPGSGVYSSQIPTPDSPYCPTISSGFGTSPSITCTNGTNAFSINVGTGTIGTTGILAMPNGYVLGDPGGNGWWASCVDVTTPGTANGGFNTKMTASSQTSVTIGGFSNTGAAAWLAGDKLVCSARSF